MSWLLLGIAFFFFLLWCTAESEGRGFHLFESWRYWRLRKKSHGNYTPVKSYSGSGGLSVNSYESTNEDPDVDPDYDPEDHVARTSSNGW